MEIVSSMGIDSSGNWKLEIPFLLAQYSISLKVSKVSSLSFSIHPKNTLDLLYEIQPCTVPLSKAPGLWTYI